MRFWFVRSDEVTLREQIVAQVTLGIASGELPRGSRLPSTRALARRFGLHPNTVSAAYMKLQQNGAVERRHGSGVYVCEASPAEPASVVDVLMGQLLAAARRTRVPLEDLRVRLERAMALQGARWCLLESDAALAAIVQQELAEQVGVVVEVHAVETASVDALRGCTVLVLPSKLTRVRASLPAEVEVTALQISAVPEQMEFWLRRRAAASLVGVASGWAPFLEVSRTMLLAAGVDADCLLLRDRSAAGWERGLEQTSGVVCDVLTAPLLPPGCQAIVYRFVSEASVHQLRTRMAGESRRGQTAVQK